MPKFKICDRCGKSRVIWKNHKGERFCKQCWGAQTPVKQPNITSKKRLPPRSSKMITSLKEYSILRKKFLEEHSMCQAHLVDCLQYSSEVHHKKGRGIYLLDTSTWLAVCRNCHSYIETHPEFAKLYGYSTNRL